MSPKKPNASSDPPLWRERLHEIIFEADTPAGIAFDVFLLIAILVSVIATCWETVDPYGTEYRSTFLTIEWTVTILFVIEYILRIICVKRPTGYIFSFFGIVDFLAILPAFIGFATHSQGVTRFAVIRSLRLLRVFRVFQLGWFVSEADALGRAVWQSRAKIVVFLFTVIILVTLAGTIMYLLEGTVPDTKFRSIPDGIYWAIVTMTTVGYGDVVPTTAWGKFMSAILILLGYSLIIVPTGFVSAELATSAVSNVNTIACAHCMEESHERDAVYCRSCGEKL